MARIAGVDLPRTKRIEIALTYIYGIGKAKSLEILKKADISPDKRTEALKSYTWNNAFATFWERDIGSLAVGKLADITVLDRDIMTIPEAQIPATRVFYTIVGGRVRYEAPRAPRR